MELRALGPGDEHTAEQACRVFGAEGSLDAAPFLARPETVLVVAEDGAEIAGWVYGHELAHPDGERTMLLYELEVAPQHRRRGFGTALVTAFVDHARAAGCTEVWVLTDGDDPAATGTYGAAGARRDPEPTTMLTWKLAEGRHSGP